MQILGEELNLDVIFYRSATLIRSGFGLMTSRWGRDIRPFGSTVATSSEHLGTMPLVIPLQNFGITSRADTPAFATRIVLSGGARQESPTAAIAKLQFVRRHVAITALSLQPRIE